MLSIKLGNTTIYFWPLVLVFAIAVVGFVIRVFWLSNTTKRMIKLCRTGKYRESIVIASKQLNYYERILIVSKNKNTKATVDILYLYIAISNLGLHNDNMFIQNIHSVSENNYEKHFWLALFYLLKNDLDEFQNHYDTLSSKHVNPNYLVYLSALKQYREDSDSGAGDILSDIYSKLNFELLKTISQK